MRSFNKLQLLQIIDSAVLIALLAMIGFLVWFGISDVTNRTQTDVSSSIVSLEHAEQTLELANKLESLIDHQRETLERLHEELHFSLPDGTAFTEDKNNLKALSELVEQQKLAFLQNWPSSASSDLQAEYTTNMQAVTRLVDEITEASPHQRQSLLLEARKTLSQSQDVMDSLEDIDNQMLDDFAFTLRQSIKTTNTSAQQIITQLTMIQQRTLWSMAFLMFLLIISRWYFSQRSKHMTQTAQRAQAVAEEAVKTKARFLATMSHEIRTPMNGVIGMTRLLMNTPMSKKQTEFVESIYLSGEHLLTVINDVLDFSKIEAGKLDLKREAFELRSCIEEVLNLLTSKALEKNLEIAYAVGPSIPLYIEGDMVRLRQVLTNLLGNAIKFTDSGEVTIFVMPRSQIGDVIELEFQINDTGPGIPQDRLETIFEQFSRADDTLVKRHEGTGLGLAISRRLVEMMEGQIWAESTLGIGSRFHFTVKTRKAEGKLKPFLHPNIPEIIGKRILIVENNPANHQALHDYCCGWGAVVEATCSSTEAISLVASGKNYDIGLVDSNLPNATALEFGQFVRQRFSKQTFPLILIAPPNDTHPKDVVRELFNLYLTKPITRSRLFDSLMTVLGELNLVTIRHERSNIKLGERLPLTILLAEDNPINQIVASSILDEMAYKVDIAENGKDVIKALQRKAYNVIFMDMQMPEMDGLEATRRIRAEFPHEHQPIIIAMTANAMEGDKQECLEAGMNDYISKPILPETVEAALQRWCESHLSQTTQG